MRIVYCSKLFAHNVSPNTSKHRRSRKDSSSISLHSNVNTRSVNKLKRIVQLRRQYTLCWITIAEVRLGLLLHTYRHASVCDGSQLSNWVIKQPQMSLKYEWIHKPNPSLSTHLDNYLIYILKDFAAGRAQTLSG